MATLFTKIINGELPGHFVWKDEHCVAFLSIAPMKPGHTLIVPRDEVDHWIDLTPEVNMHLAKVSQAIGQGLDRAYSPVKVGSMILGLEVNHVHIHVVPIWSPTDLDFANADHKAKQEDLALAAETLRESLKALGHGESVSD